MSPKFNISIRRKNLSEKKITINLSSYKKTIEKILTLLPSSHFQGCETVELSVLLTDNNYIAELNNDYRGKKSPTDVLSFPIDTEFHEIGHKILGDIVISVEKAEEQGASNGLKRSQEMTVLTLHGLLHLLGYTHQQGTQERIEMQDIEASLLKDLNLPSGGLMSR
ncbi:MAG: rRNA maturation RNase YbeY [Nitrospinae bacterium]|nr:rRNA maturation RNase YbeY [Nitrospinota bacterium]